MKTLADPGHALTGELAAIRVQYQVPEAFPPEVLAAAERAARLAPVEHVDPPEQEVEALADGRYALRFRPRYQAESRNASLSLATNIAIADVLLAHRTGLFRVMADPDARAVKRLRLTAAAFGLDWPRAMTLADFSRGLDAAESKHAAFMLAVRRAGTGATYAPFLDGKVPWHSAMAATYAHATAPLRRLADRYVVDAALAIANGREVPAAATAAFARLPKVMARADALSGQVELAVIDLAEAAMLCGREGEQFTALVTDVDERGVRMQLCDLPVVARIVAHRVTPGVAMTVRLVGADPTTRKIEFQRNG